jgi:hypothetical protein
MNNGPLITLIYLLSLIFYIYYLLFICRLSIYSYSSLIHLSHIHLLSFTYSSRLYPASFPAGRIPSCGGIARPKGKHSRRMTVFCLPCR